MKKSRSIKLALLGSASMALAACGDDGPPDDSRFFAETRECAAVYGDAPCADAALMAEETHLVQAPKFALREQCEAEFGDGNCETRQTASGSSFFMPLLMGYMMGNMLSGNRFSQPVYRGRDGGAVMNNGGRLFNVGNFGGTTAAGRTASFRPAQASPIARGGFGSMSAAYNSGAAS
jgi:uncharacterized protein YgiB involved in biofilm formation